jgi:hypothetical protein
MGSTNFSSFKTSQAQNFDRLREELNKTKGGDRKEDERFWKPERGKDGNDYAVIRFLPAGPGEELPYVKTHSYGFKGPGGWYIENSRSTIDADDDPVDQMRRKLYASGTDADKELAKKFPRRTNFTSNIEIVDYPKKPELNGKRFLFRYGKKIFDKINDAMNPKFPDEPRINPFNFWEGADFVLKVTTQDDFPNYDKSEFRKASPHRGGDDKVLEQIWNELYPLGEFVDPSSSHFKPAKALQKRLNRVLGLDEPADDSRQEPRGEEPKQRAPDFKAEAQRFARKDEPVKDEPVKSETKPVAAKSDDKPWDDGEDEMAFFRNAAGLSK